MLPRQGEAIVTSKEEYTNLIQNLKRSKNNAKRFEAAFYEVFGRFRNEIELKMGINGLPLAELRDDLKKSFQWFDKVFDDALKVHSDLQLALPLILIAKCHWWFHNTPKAAKYYRKSLYSGHKYDDSYDSISWISQFGDFFMKISLDDSEERLKLEDMKALENCLISPHKEAYFLCTYNRAIYLSEVDSISKNVDEGLTILRLCLKMAPKVDLSKLAHLDIDVNAITFRIGICHRQMKNYLLAIRVFEKIIKQSENPKDRFVLRLGLKSMFYRGLCLKDLRKNDEAEYALRSFVNYFESDRASRFWFKDDLLMKQLKSDACGTVKDLLDLREKANKEKLKKKKVAREDYEKIKTADDLLENTYKLICKEENYQGALKMVEEAFALKFEAYKANIPLAERIAIDHRKAECFKGINKHEAAIEHYRRIIKCITDKNNQEHYNKALLTKLYLEMVGCYDDLVYNAECLHYTKKYLPLIENANPEKCHALWMIGRISMELGLYKQGITYIEKCLKVQVPINYYLTKCYMGLGICQYNSDNLERAMQALQKGLDISYALPRDPVHWENEDFVRLCMHLYMVKSLMKLGRFHDAMESLNTTKKLIERSFGEKVRSQRHVPDFVLQQLLSDHPTFNATAILKLLCQKASKVKDMSTLDYCLDLVCRITEDQKGVVNRAFYAIGFVDDQELAKDFLSVIREHADNHLTNSVHPIYGNRQAFLRFHNSAHISNFFKHVHKKRNKVQC